MIELAICDDEISAIQSLKNQIHSFFTSKDIEYSVSSFLDGESLLNIMFEKSKHFDIVLLDIRMSRISGMDVAKSIRSSVSENVCIIFVTALKEYVFEAFDVSAANYLVKPIDTQKLHTTFEKIISEIISSETKFLLLHKGGAVNKIPLCNIMYCEVVNHRVYIYEKSYIHKYSGKIGDLEQELNHDFFRCHRSFIVNLKYVEKCSAGFAYMPSAEKIPIATRRQGEFMKALLSYQRKEVR